MGLARLWRKLRRRRGDAAVLAEEVAGHLEALEGEHRARGLSPAGARDAARRQFGRVTIVQADVRDDLGFGAVERAVHDFRHAGRTLRKSPGFAIVSVLTLSVGIGATTAMFSIVNSVLLDPLRYRQPERLFAIVNVPPSDRAPGRYWHINARHFHDWRAGCRSCEDVAIAEGIGLTLTGRGEPERVPSLRVSYNFFRTLGVQPRLGRDFRPEEEMPGNFHEVVLSDGLWRSRFASDPGVVGQAISINREPHVIVGVMPPHFQLPVGDQWGPNGFGPATQPLMFRPLGFDVSQARPEGNLNFVSIVRLKPAVPPEQATAELESLIAELLREYRIESRPALLLLQETVTSGARVQMWLLLGTIGAVLLIISVNVGTLMMARITGRRRELVIRMALGSSGARLVRLVFIEALVLVAAGAAAGWALALVALKMVVAWGPADVPRIGDIHAGPAALLFAAAIAVIATMVCGLPAAWRLSRTDPQLALKADAADSSGRSRVRGRELQVAAQVALSTVLLIVGALLALSVLRVMRVPKGFEAARVVATDVSLSNPAYSEADRIRFVAESLTRLEAVAGVESVGVTNQLPVRGETWICTLRDIGVAAPSTTLANFRFVSGGYWKAMGIALKKGRLLEPADRNRAVAVVSERAAHTLWAGQDPIGKRVGGCGGNLAPRQLEVIGVVADVRAQIEDDAPPTVYQPYWHNATSRPYFVARTTGNPAAIAGELRSALRSIDAYLPVSPIVTMDQVVDDVTIVRRLQGQIALAFALVALVVSACGIYGVVAYSVARRTQEIGIRVALGAQGSQVMGLVMRQSLAVVAAGVAIGLATAAVVTPNIQAALFGVAPLDPRTFVAVAVVLMTVGALASYIPARRAACVNPILALKRD
jgi:putative ABC transport system permease protein